MHFQPGEGPNRGLLRDCEWNFSLCKGLWPWIMSPFLFLWTDFELRNFSSIPAKSAVSALTLKYDDPWLLLLIFCTTIRLKTFLLCTIPLHNGTWELKGMNLQKLDNFWFHKTRRTKSGLKLEFLCKNKPHIHTKYFFILKIDWARPLSLPWPILPTVQWHGCLGEV